MEVLKRTNRLESIKVPAPMREDTTGNAQPLDSAGSTIKSDAIEVVPAPMREEVNEIVQPLDSAWTNRLNANRVPAPMSEDVNGGESPHEYAGTNRLKSIRVPAPRLELGTP